jgi:hypothetical protein
MHHLSRGNRNGALAQLRKSLAKLNFPLPQDIPEEVAAIVLELRKTLENLEVSAPRTPRLQ